MTRELIEDDFDKLSQRAVTVHVPKVLSANTLSPCVWRVIPASMDRPFSLKADRGVSSYLCAAIR